MQASLTKTYASYKNLIQTLPTPIMYELIHLDQDYTVPILYEMRETHDTRC